MGDDRLLGAKATLAVVGHELASPLSALMTFAKIAERGDPEALAKLRECARRVREIVEMTRVTLASRDEVHAFAIRSIGPDAGDGVFGAAATAWRAIDPWDGRGQLASWLIALAVAELGGTAEIGNVEGDIGVRIRW